MPWTTQSLNLAPGVEAWCTVRPYCQAAESYRVALQPVELIQIASFFPQMAEFAKMHVDRF